MIINDNQRQCFVCEDFWFNSSKEIIRHSVCKKLPVVYPHNGNFYCVLHLPDETKHERTDYFYVLSERINNEEFDFSYVYFPEENFSFYGRTIKKPVRFWFSVFLGQVTFDEVTFRKEADFRFATFEKHASFHNTKFLDEVIFPSTTFKNRVSFHAAEFSNNVDFDSASFEGDSNFSSAIFNENAKFRNSKFEDESWFSSTQFKGGVDFVSVVFNKMAVFSNAVFEKGVRFYWAVFKGRGEFSGVTFQEDALFDAVNFTEESEIDFKQTIFKKAAKFGRTIFSGYVNFSGLDGKQVFSEVDCVLDLQEARFVNPEKLVFRSVLLNPRWFIAADSRKISFIDIDEKFYNADVKNELKKLQEVGINNSKALFKITCRELAENAENNNRFEEASKFRQMAFECERLEREEKISKWWNEPINCLSLFEKSKEKAKSFPFDLFHWGYRWSSGYGENRLWAFFILFLILSISAILYTTPLCEFPSGQNEVRSLGFIESISYSLRVMVLQRPEPFPINDFGKIVLAFETVLAPLQLALLALAIRRKFMR